MDIRHNPIFVLNSQKQKEISNNSIDIFDFNFHNKLNLN